MKHFININIMRILLLIFLFHTATLAQENETYHEMVFFEMKFLAEESISSSITTTTNKIVNHAHASEVSLRIEFYVHRLDSQQTIPSKLYIPQYLASYVVLEENFNLIQPKLQMSLQRFVEKEPKGNKSISSWLKPFHHIDVFKNTSVLGSGFGPVIML